MLQYINGFSCAADTEKENFFISFLQSHPKLEVDDDTNDTEVENVAAVVMNMSTAKKLLEALQDMMDEQEDVVG